MPHTSASRRLVHGDYAQEWFDFAHQPPRSVARSPFGYAQDKLRRSVEPFLSPSITRAGKRSRWVAQALFGPMPHAHAKV